MLSSREIIDTLESRLSVAQDWDRQTFEWYAAADFPIEVVCYVHEKEKIALFCSPLAVTRPATITDDMEPVYSEVVDKFRQTHNATWKVAAILIGKGTTERHYVASFTDEGGTQTLFDSKITDPDRYLSSPQYPGILERIWGVFSAPFRTLAFWLGFGRQVRSESSYAVINRTGHQPLLDGVSCGYHAGGLLLELVDNPGMNPEDLHTSAMHGGHDGRFEHAMPHPPVHTPNPAGLHGRAGASARTSAAAPSPKSAQSGPPFMAPSKM